MAQEFLQKLERLLDGLKGIRASTGGIECKHFFSGAAAYVDGRIFMTLTPAGLALKLTEEDCAKLLALGGTHLRYFPKAPIKKNYAIVPAQLADGGERLEAWGARSIEFVRK